MTNHILKTIYESTENPFLYYTLPTIIAASTIIFLWLFLIFIAKIFKRKSDKWKSSEFQESFFRQFIVTHQSLFRKTIVSLRWISTLYILFNLSSLLFSTFGSNLKESMNQKTIAADKLWNSIANYSYQISSAFTQINHLMISIFFTIIIAVWCIRISQKAINIVIFKSGKHKFEIASGRSSAKKNTINSVTNQLIRIVIVVIAAFTILETLGINIAALLATAGLASVAIGFGAQSLVKDFIAGFFILLEDQFAVGDVVELSTSSGLFSGSIEKMTLRMLKLRSNEGSLLTIPNGDVRSVKNYTTDWSRVDFKYCLEIKSDLNKASIVFREEIEKLYNDYNTDVIDKPDIRPMEKIVDHENRSVATTFRAFIKTTSTSNKLKLEMEFNKRLVERFKAENVYLK